MSEGLEFDVALREIPVRVGDEEYVLKEASGEAAARYKDACLQCMTFGSEGKVSKALGLASTEAWLVSLCLFKRTDRGDKPVSQSTIRSWPAGVVRTLFSKAKEISELDDDENTAESLTKQRAEIERRLQKLQEDAAKNELSDTTSGSS